MRLHNLTLTALSLGVLGSLLGCSSEDPMVGDEVASGSGGTVSSSGGASNGGSIGGFGSDGGIIIGSGGGSQGGSGGGGSEVFDGGLVPLTPEQIAALDDGGECAGLTQEAIKLPPVVQLVVDVSLSMDEVAPGNEPRSKWDVTRDALVSTLSALPDDMPVGLQLYPTESAFGGGGPFGPGGGFPGPGGGAGGTDAGGLGTGGSDLGPQQQQAVSCVGSEGAVAIDALGPADSAQRAALGDAIATAELTGATPTHDAFNVALEDSLKLHMSGARKFMILLTDGAPTQPEGCGAYNPGVLQPDGPEVTAVIGAISDAHAEGIDTFVIGSPGSENGAPPGQTDGPDMRPWLSEAAIAGGTAPEGCSSAGPNFCHFDMTQTADFGASLAQALAEITGQVSATCEFALPDDIDKESVDEELTAVVLQWSDGSAGRAVLDKMGECTDGWKWGGADGNSIELCDNTCTAFKMDGGAKVNVSFECLTIVR